MDLVALESFVTICDLKNFTKAAEKLFISQPALSRRMKSLESELGIQLFIKHGTSIEAVSDAGKFLYKEAVKIIDETDKLLLNINRFRAGISGTLRIAVSTSFPLITTIKAIKRMSNAWPDIEIIPESYTDLNMFHLLSEKMVDVAVASKAEVEDIPGTTYEVIKENVSSALVCRGHKLYDRNKISLMDLNGEPCLSLFSANPIIKAKILQWMGSMDIKPGEIINCRSYEEVLLYLSTGKYYFLPGILTNELLLSFGDEFRNIPLIEGQVSIGHQVVAYNEKSELVNKFIYCINEAVKE